MLQLLAHATETEDHDDNAAHYVENCIFDVVDHIEVVSEADGEVQIEGHLGVPEQSRVVIVPRDFKQALDHLQLVHFVW